MLETPTASPSYLDLNAPALRTVSLGKKVWEQETANFLGRPHARTQSVASVASQDAGAAQGRPAPRPCSVFGLPMLSCCTRCYHTWALLILLLDLSYSAFIVPISIGLQVNDLEWTWSCIVSLVAGAFFSVELYCGFHVGYLATSGGRRREVLEGQKVARYYIRRGTFWQDLLSTAIWLMQIVLLVLHHSGVSMPSAASAFSLVRIVRMVRFLPILRSLSAMTIAAGPSIIPGLRLPPALSHVVNILYAGLVLVNFFGCLFNFIAIKEGFDNTWLNSVGQLVRQYSADGVSMLTPEELAAVPGPRRWLTGFYFSLVTVATLGYGDITPSTAAETAVDCFQVAFGVLMFGMIMGSIADQVGNWSREAQQAQMYREKIASVHAWLRSCSMPRVLKSKVNSFYAEVWVKHASAADASSVFFELPHKLRQEIAWEMNRKMMQQLPFFERVDETIQLVLSSFMAPLELLPGQELCLRGDLADRFWILHEGEVHVLNEYSHVVRTVLGPAVLGESALLQHSDNKYCVRPHGYRSATGCSLWEVHLRDVMPFLVAHPEALEALTFSARHRLTRESMASVAAMLSYSMEEREEEKEGSACASAEEEGSGSMGGWASPAVSGEQQEGEGLGAYSTPAAPPTSPAAFGGQAGGGGEHCLDVGEEEHTVREFLAVQPWPEHEHEAAGGEATAPAGTPGRSSAGGGRGGYGYARQSSSIQLVVDARGAAVDARSPLAAATAAGGGEEEAGQLDLGAAVTRGEVLQLLEGLRGDLVGRLDDIALNLHRVARASTTQAAIPMWAAASADMRPSGRVLLHGERRSPRQLSPSRCPSHSGGSRWDFGQLRA